MRSISKLPAAERPLTILLAAHPYVSHDPFVGGVVEDALREQGACVLFADEADKARSLKKSYEFSHFIPWIVNRELIDATLLLHEHIDGIVLMSAYPCGPDSMCDDAIERCIKGKPILTLTVDAQAGTARPARSFSPANAPSSKRHSRHKVAQERNGCPELARYPARRPNLAGKTTGVRKLPGKAVDLGHPYSVFSTI